MSIGNFFFGHDTPSSSNKTNPFFLLCVLWVRDVSIGKPK